MGCSCNSNKTNVTDSTNAIKTNIYSNPNGNVVYSNVKSTVYSNKKFMPKPNIAKQPVPVASDNSMAVDPVTEPVIESIPEPATEPVVESTPEPATQAAVEKKTKNVKPTSYSNKKSAIETIVIKPTVTSTPNNSASKKKTK